MENKVSASGRLFYFFTAGEKIPFLFKNHTNTVFKCKKVGLGHQAPSCCFLRRAQIVLVHVSTPGLDFPTLTLSENLVYGGASSAATKERTV